MVGDVQRKPVARKFGWLRATILSSKAQLRGVILVSFFVNLLALSVPVFVMQVYDRVIFHGGLNTLYGLIAGIIFVLIFEYVMRQGRSRIFQAFAVRLDVIIGRKLYDKVMTLPLLTLESRPTAYWHLLFKDLEIVRNALSGPSAALAIDLPFAVIFFLIVCVIASPIAWVLVAVIPLFMVLAWRSGISMNSVSMREHDGIISRDDFMGELLSARETVKSSALQKSLKPVWEARHGELIYRSRERGQVADSHQTLAHVMMVSSTIAVTTIGALAILDQKMTIGALIAANMLGARMIMPMTQLVSQWRIFSQLRQSVTRLDTVFKLGGERLQTAVKLAVPEGTLKFEKVNFAYGNKTVDVVSGIEGVIGPKGMHALVGSNGSGKSTFLKVVRGLYSPDQGRVLIDGADISQFSQDVLAYWVGFLPQETSLFSGSIRDNIAITQPDVTDPSVIEAAKMAEAHDFILDMPDGYATMLTEGGRNLSKGQRQRLALARAFLNNPPIMLLDEPTSNLDENAEKNLAANLKIASQQSTVLAVTHSEEVLSVCDSILVMEKGRIVMAGPAKQVLDRLKF
ncbi:MAG: peptidase domain-containing ABC transporter [Pseudomonadota bacterium]|nr:peptidase domain-containing ABC transporter [Pseudomonadota bacterium]